jgi:hypothetical protein
VGSKEALEDGSVASSDGRGCAEDGAEDSDFDDGGGAEGDDIGTGDTAVAGKGDLEGGVGGIGDVASSPGAEDAAATNFASLAGVGGGNTSSTPPSLTPTPGTTNS